MLPIWPAGCCCCSGRSKYNRLFRPVVLQREETRTRTRGAVEEAERAGGDARRRRQTDCRCRRTDGRRRRTGVEERAAVEKRIGCPGCGGCGGGGNGVTRRSGGSFGSQDSDKHLQEQFSRGGDGGGGVGTGDGCGRWRRRRKSACNGWRWRRRRGHRTDAAVAVATDERRRQLGGRARAAGHGITRRSGASSPA